MIFYTFSTKQQLHRINHKPDSRKNGRTPEMPITFFCQTEAL